MILTFSLVWTIAILLLGYAKAKSNKQLLLFQFIFLLILDCNYITTTAAFLGSQEINSSDLVLAALAITSILCLVENNKIEKPLLAFVFVLSASVIVCVALNLCFPFEGKLIGASGSWDSFYYGVEAMTQVGIGARTCLVLFRLVLWLIVLCAIAAVLQVEDFIASAKAVIAFGKVHIFWSLCEFVCKNLFSSMAITNIAQTIFPSVGSTYTVLNYRGGAASLQGFTREPSHLAMALTFFLIIELLLNRKKAQKHFYIWMASAVLVMVMSGAFTAIVGLVIVFGFSLYFRFERKSGMRDIDNHFDVRILLLIALVIILLFACVPLILYCFKDTYYVHKFDNVLGNAEALLSRHYSYLAGSSDALPRVISIIECLYVFFGRLVFGIGPGVANPFSGVVATLVNYGLIVTIVWFLLIYKFSMRYSGKRGAKLFIVFIFLLGILQLGDSYTYSSCWLLLAGLFGTSSQQRFYDSQIENFKSNE